MELDWKNWRIIDFQFLTDQQLMRCKWIAMECRNLNFLEKVNEEIRRRWMYA